MNVVVVQRHVLRLSSEHFISALQDATKAREDRQTARHHIVVAMHISGVTWLGRSLLPSLASLGHNRSTTDRDRIRSRKRAAS